MTKSQFASILKIVQKLQYFDEKVYHWINSFDAGFLTPFFLFLSNDRALFYLILPIGVIVIFFRRKGWLTCFLLVTVTVLITDSISFFLLKEWFGRLRPCVTLIPNIVMRLPGCGSPYGFPSNHAANTMATATIIYLYFRKKWTLIFFILSGLVGFSRVFIGVHYPFDVLAGFFFGALIATLLFKGVYTPLKGVILQLGPKGTGHTKSTHNKNG